MNSSDLTLDRREFRNALGSFATGVTIITAVGPKNELIGLTANSFSSVSLDPPLVLFSLDRRAYSLRGFLSTHYFAVNVLHEDQHELSHMFAQPFSKTWDGVPHEFWSTGCPVITGALANFECQTRYTYHGGDHVIFVGEVERMAWHPEGNPLLFFRGRYHGVREHGGLSSATGAPERREGD